MHHSCLVSHNLRREYKMTKQTVAVTGRSKPENPILSHKAEMAMVLFSLRPYRLTPIVSKFILVLYMSIHMSQYLQNMISS